MSDPSQSPLPEDPKTELQISKTKSKWRNPVWWLKEIATIIVLFIVITFALDWWQSRDMPNGNVPHTILTTLSGDTFDLATASKDEPVVLYFWATWCPACKFVTPTPGVRIVVQILERPKIQQWRANEGHYAEIFRRKKSCHLEEATATA